MAALVLLVAAPAGAQMQVESGTYTGDTIDNRLIFVGFQPDVVIVDRDDPGTPATNFEAVIRTSTMLGDNAKEIDDSETFGSALAADLIQSLGATGFTIGTDAKVNQGGITYYWIAFRAAPGELALGTYAGTGVAQDIMSVGFAPDYVLAMSAGAQNVVQKSSPMPATFSQDFIAIGYTDAILNMRVDGFRVGGNPIANANLDTFHYVAWKAVTGRVAVNTYTGDENDNRDFTGVGFWPEWVVVSRSSNAAGSQASPPVHKPASSGVGVDSTLLFDSTLAENNDIQELQPDGFQLGQRVPVNGNVAPNTYYWAAFGPHEPQTNLRSIGTAPDYGTGTVSVTTGSTFVNGTGTAWLTANRGRGDVLTVPCPDPPTCTGGVNYTVTSISGEAALQITPGYAGITSPTVSYLLRRQYTTLDGWETCIDGGPCSFFPDPSNSLVADDRREVGIAYKDSVFAIGGDFDIDGSTTDAVHTITLTADRGNRHYGLAGAGVVLDNRRLRVQDDYVTVEWLEIRNGTANELVETNNQATLNQLVLRFLLLHNAPDRGVRIRDSNTVADVYNNIVYRTSGDVLSTSVARDAAADLSSIFATDIDEGLRVAPWDIGADEFGAALLTADLTITKDDGQAVAVPGTAVSYTLTVTNNGPSGATMVSVLDPLPVDMELDTAPGAITPSQGSCNYTAPTRTVSCDLGNLGPTLVATVTIKVRPQAQGSFLNTASVTRTETDPVPANDSEDETTLVEISSLGVPFLTATSTNQRNVVEWVNPTDVDFVSTEVVWRTDRFPAGPGDGTALYNAGVSGGREKQPHDIPPLTNGQTYYYGAFVHRALPPLVSPGRFVTGRPFDHIPGPVKWAFSTGATAIAAPTVGGAGVIATSNDNVVYAMERGVDDDQVGVDSGEWPLSFRPVELGGPVQLRSPVIPITVGAANPVAYLGSQDGSVYVVDATQGGPGFPWGPTSIGPMVQAAPAGIFTAFLGTLDYLLVGTRDGAYQGNSMNTVWCFELDSSVPVFTPCWVRQLGDMDSSPVLNGGRIYVGSPLGGGTVYSLIATTGLDDRTFPHGDGQVRGFVFPDRGSNDIYFATDDFVWGVTDTGAPVMTDKFGGGISLPAGAKPSAVLFVPGSHFLYVGGSDGKLYELDTLLAIPVPKPVTLGDGLAAVGAPSLDRGFDLVHVGAEAGIFYAVEVPLP